MKDILKAEYVAYLCYNGINLQYFNEFFHKYYHIINNKNINLLKTFPLIQFTIYKRSDSTENVEFKFYNGFTGNIPYNRLVKYTDYRVLEEETGKEIIEEIFTLNINNKIWILFNILCYFGTFNIYLIYNNTLNLTIDESATLIKLVQLFRMGNEYMIDDKNYFIKYKEFCDTLPSLLEKHKEMNIEELEDNEEYREIMDNLKSNDNEDLKDFEYDFNEEIVYNIKRDMFYGNILLESKLTKLVKHCIYDIINYIKNNVTYELNNPLIIELIKLISKRTFKMEEEFPNEYLNFILNNQIDDIELNKRKEEIVHITELYERYYIEKSNKMDEYNATMELERQNFIKNNY
jgi:hypothetical protein